MNAEMEKIVNGFGDHTDMATKRKKPTASTTKNHTNIEHDICLDF